MSKILLDYVFPISVITPTPEASTAFLKQACLVTKPKSGQEGNVGTIYECDTMTEVAARTDNENAQQLFNGGMSKVYILLADDLDLETFLADGAASDFYTLLISDDFDDSDIEDGVATPAVKASRKIQDITYEADTAGTAGNSISITLVNDGTGGSETVGVVASAITVHMQTGVSTAANIKTAIENSVPAVALVNVTVDSGDESDVQSAQTILSLQNGAAAIPGTDGMAVGDWEGVIGVSSDDEDFCGEQAAIENRVAFFTLSANGAKNMCYAFGKMLSNASNWRNQQYITMPFDDLVATVGAANSLFDDKVSFVISDDEFGKRLALFSVGGKAIVAPYILKNLRIDLQSSALSWISGNQPQYTLKEAALLETRLQEDVINVDYIQRNLITAGTIAISLVNENFVATGDINVSEPKALWRVFNEMRQTL